MDKLVSLSSEAKKFVEKSLGPISSIEAMRAGQHSVFKIVGKKLAILKIFERNVMKWQLELHCLNHFRQCIPVPEVLASHRTDNEAYLLLEYIQGENLRVLLEEGARESQLILNAAAEMACKVHSQGKDFAFSHPEAFQRDSASKLFFTADPWLGSWRKQLEERGRRLGAARIAAAYKELGNWRAEMEACGKNPQFIHGDFQPKNILVHDGTIRAIIDWELARIGLPINDLALLLRFAANDEVESKIADSFSQGRISPDALRIAARVYDILRIGLGMTHEGPDTDDVPLWLAYFDSCLHWLGTGEAESLRLAARDLLKL